MLVSDIDRKHIENKYHGENFDSFNRFVYHGYDFDENTGLSDEEIYKIIDTYSARPGTSDHQTGLCVDLITDEMVGLYNYGSETTKNPYDKGFAETAAYEWLKEHAHEYGFILRFPENKTDITGYSYESWHYRYVGIEHATKIHEKGITLEEYLESDGE